MNENMIYMDNAATSWPKPESVVNAMTDAITRFGGNPGRGGHHLALAAGELMYNARERCASFFGCNDPFRLTFTQNITMAINMVLRGFLSHADHVLVSPMEHNAVMRPLTMLNIAYDIIPGKPDGTVDPNTIPAMIRPNTKLIIICHESNVNGIVQPLKQIGRTARENHIYLLADCAQSAGHIPINIDSDFIDFLCFTGHKSLFGPTGTGGVVFGDRIDIERIHPLICGGTGSLSESFLQPEFLPDHLESGTQNVCGIAGLNAGIEWIEETGIQNIHNKCSELISRLRIGINLIQSTKCFSGQGQVLSLIMTGKDNGLIASELQEKYGIMTRIGLHCAPLAHRTLGTFPNGTIRFAVSPFTSEHDIYICLQAFREIAEVS